MRKVIFLTLLLLIGFTPVLSASTVQDSPSISPYNACGSAKVAATPTNNVVTFSSSIKKKIGNYVYYSRTSSGRNLPKVPGVPFYNSVRVIINTVRHDSSVETVKINTVSTPGLNKSASYYLATSQKISQKKWTYLDSDCNSIHTYYGDKYIYATTSQAQVGSKVPNSAIKLGSIR